MARQLDWRDFFGQTERQWQARMRLLEGLPVDPRVVALLRALDELTQEHRVPIVDGTMTVEASLKELKRRLNVKARNTVKSYVDLAETTPYLDKVESNHSAHTYRLCWMRIIDDSKSDAAAPGGAERTAVRRRDLVQEGSIQTTGGSIDPLRGGQLTPSKGVNWRPPRGSIGGGQLEASSPLGFNTQGFNRCNTKTQGSKTKSGGGLQGGQSSPGSKPKSYPREVWRDWKAAIADSNLADPRDVLRLFEYAVSVGMVTDSEADRFEVFTQAAHDVRLAQTPGLLFKSNVPIGRWLDAWCDQVRAKEMLAELDGLRAPKPVPPGPQLMRDPADRDARVRRLQFELRELLTDKTPAQLAEEFGLPPRLHERLQRFPTFRHLDRDWWLLLDLLEGIAARVGAAAAVP